MPLERQAWMPRRRPEGLLLVLVFVGACCASRSAWAEGGGTISMTCMGEPTGAVLAALADLGGGDQHLATALLSQGGVASRLTFSLVRASPASQHQAIAHALGTWWARDHDGIVYLRSLVLPLGPVRTSTYTSNLLGREDVEDIAQHLLSPWMDRPTTGLAMTPEDGLWSATLDGQGHARLVELLSLLERSRPVCPSLLPDPDQPDPRARLDEDVSSADLPHFAWRLARESGVSVSIGPSLAQNPPHGPLVCHRGPVVTLAVQLSAQGIAAAIIHGVLCLDRSPVMDTEHPAQRRRLALIGVGHLELGHGRADRLVEAIKLRVAPGWWSLPGAGLFFMASQHQLLAAADPATLAVLYDALEAIDRSSLSRWEATTPPLRAAASPHEPWIPSPAAQP